MTATFADLIEVRSQTARALLEFLPELAERLDKTPWRRRNGSGTQTISAKDIFVEPTVLTRRRRDDSPATARRADGQPRREAGDGDRLSPFDEIHAALYELPTDAHERQEQRWRQFFGQGRRHRALHGAPGGGKTLATRHALAELARREHKRLDECQVGFDELTAPIWVTAASLAKASGSRIEEQLLNALADSFGYQPLPEIVSQWFLRALEDGRAVVVVDALDELQAQAEGDAFKKRAELLGHLPVRVLVTCRTLQWDDRRSWLGWSDIEEGELAPLALRQQREFVRKFLRNDRQRGEMLGPLQANYALRHACRTPLLITFACLLHEDGMVTQSTTIGELYAHMLRKFISGKWRPGTKPPWANGSVKKERCLGFLERLTWHLFRAAPEQNRFTLAAWDEAANRATGKGKATSARPIDSDDLLEDLVGVGLVVPAGDDVGDPCWSFGHRSFLEFLAARALSRCKPDEWLAEVRGHFWFEPEWVEVLTLLAGLVDDATPLIEAVKKERKNDDIFGSMLAMAARLVGAASQMDDGVEQGVARDMLVFFEAKSKEPHGALQEFVVGMLLGLCGNLRVRKRVVDRLLELSHDEYRFVRSAAAKALGEIGSERAVDPLLELSHDEAYFVRLRAAKALGEIGSERAVDRLLELCGDGEFGVRWAAEAPDEIGYEQYLVRRAAAEAVGRIGHERAVDRLLELFHHRDYQVHCAVANALGQIGSESVVNRLLELFHHEDYEVRCAAANALGQIGSERVVSRLRELSHDEHWFVRSAAAEALGEIGSERALDRLLALCGDEHSAVRKSAAKALGKIGSERAVDRLLALCRDNDRWVCSMAACALGQFGSERVVDRVLALYGDKEPWECSAAAEALGLIGSERAVEWLLELCGDERSGVRSSAAAAEALGKIGSERAVDRLLELSHNEHWSVREEAVYALGEIGSDRAVDRLLELCGDERWFSVRAATARALAKIGSGRAVNRLLELSRDEDQHVRREAMRALAVIGSEPAVDRLLKLCEEESASVRGEAAQALDAIRSERAVDRLLRLCGHKDIAVRQAAGCALWHIAVKHRLRIRPPR